MKASSFEHRDRPPPAAQLPVPTDSERRSGPARVVAGRAGASDLLGILRLWETVTATAWLE